MINFIMQQVDTIVSTGINSISLLIPFMLLLICFVGQAKDFKEVTKKILKER